MLKNIALLLCGCFITLGGFSQSTAIEVALQNIEQNNLELQALVNLGENKRLELLSGNRPPDPQAGAYYLPFGTHTPGDYWEFEISQSIEFPTVYGARKQWIDAQVLETELALRVRRQAILLESEQLCIALIHTRKRLELETERFEQAKKVEEQVAALYEKGQVGILALNKAKVAWMQVQFAVQHVENEESGLLLSLQELNGGQALAFEAVAYEDALLLPEKDDLWQAMLAQDPALRQLNQRQATATQGMKVAKSEGLPDITAGYNYQGIAGSNYSGVYAGVSIPLWNNRHKVNAARSGLTYTKAVFHAETTQARLGFEKQYQTYQLQLSEFEAYRKTMDGMNSESLLFQAYELGEISFLEYHMELQFYRQAIDAMLLQEKNMHLRKAELQRHLL
jgi:outer membrane protein TolC